MRKLYVLLCVVSILSGCGGSEYESDDNDLKDLAYNKPFKNEVEAIVGEVPVWKIPDARFVVKLSWKQGFSSNIESSSDVEGTKVDLDLHLIKKHSLEAPEYGYEPEEGVMFTNILSGFDDYDPHEDLDNDGKPDYEGFFRHDDCYFGDKGYYSQVEIGTLDGSNEWNCVFIRDNMWGGDNYNDPEVITIGLNRDKNRDGTIDDEVLNDQYLIVVHYSYCTPEFEDGRDTCDPEYKGDDQAYEVDARIEIFVDGEKVPRPKKSWRPADNFSENSQNFKIHPGELKVIGVIKWDNKMMGRSMQGGLVSDAIVTDIDMPEHNIETNASEYKTCLFPTAYNHLIPIWNGEAYYELVDSPQNPYDETSPKNGKCF